MLAPACSVRQNVSTHASVRRRLSRASLEQSMAKVSTHASVRRRLIRCVTSTRLRGFQLTPP